jgi:hypothetical protein
MSLPKGDKYMRKSLINPASQEVKPSQSHWIDVENLARVELSSEDPAHPIESALSTSAGPGWLAAQPGAQTIRISFDTPVQLRQIYLEFIEKGVSRTQEFVLRWSPDQGQTFREIVRQQYNFNPPETSNEKEEYRVDLSGVTVLELNIDPAQGRSDVRASLARLLLA